MAGFYMPQRQMLTVKDFDSPHTISIINEIAYDWDDSTSVFSILPPFFEVFHYHLSTSNIPSDDDYNTDLPLIRACFIAFTKGVPDIYQSTYEIRALMGTLTSFDERIEEMSEIVQSRYEIEDMATVIMQGIIEAQSCQPQKYIDYVRSGKLLAFCTLVLDDIFDCLVAQKSIMWSCRAIRTLVSKPKRYSPSEGRLRMVVLQHLLGGIGLPPPRVGIDDPSGHEARQEVQVDMRTRCPNKENTSRASSRRCGGCLNMMHCSSECQKIDWKAIPGYHLSCLENQSRQKDGKSYRISRIDLEFCFARCRDDIRVHLNLICALRTQDLNEQAENPDPVATTIVMSYCGPGKDVRMLRKDISTCAALVGEDKWLSVKKAGEDVIIVMEIPRAGDQSHYAFLLSESGITL
ncbi:hypothetical protein ARMSODRAFT_976222 [Armillaria solidipes]|uniref:MYND-type domain-containing protein n=1 Tax=Armillaria solidipes TaxID=1076256 RepID=A0A2H3BAM9_9AGAR|nr:hypothetical protein ARMSODRAFT_976222 [Armillaria solidipes]